MPHILLLGAGFSRNWGGLLASEVFNALLAAPEIQSDPQLRNILWNNQQAGGFENALAVLQQAHLRRGARNHQQLLRFQQAVLNVFQAMNQSFLDRPDIEFQQHQARMLRTFLIKFDAIFTLNQDVLLDHHYLNTNIALAAPQRGQMALKCPACNESRGTKLSLHRPGAGTPGFLCHRRRSKLNNGHNRTSNYTAQQTGVIPKVASCS